MGEGGSRSRVGQVVGRHVNRLYRCDRAFLGGSDALLQSAHFRGKRRLITDGGRHTSQQSRNLAARLCESEDVVDKEQNVLVFPVAEVFRHGKTRESHSHSGSRRFVHLTVDKRRLVDNAGFHHFIIEVVALAGAFSDARKDR